MEETNKTETKRRKAKADKEDDVEIEVKTTEELEPEEPVASDVETQKQTHRTYTVKEGDSLWTISKKYLGQGSRYREIKSLNKLKSDIIQIGQELKLPNK